MVTTRRAERDRRQATKSQESTTQTSTRSRAKPVPFSTSKKMVKNSLETILNSLRSSLSSTIRARQSSETLTRSRSVSIPTTLKLGAFLLIAKTVLRKTLASANASLS